MMRDDHRAIDSLELADAATQFDLEFKAADSSDLELLSGHGRETGSGRQVTAEPWSFQKQHLPSSVRRWLQASTTSLASTGTDIYSFGQAPISLRIVGQNLRSWARGLKPSFLRNDTANISEKLSQTSYLNGVRGVACAIVYVSHTHFDLSIRDIVDKPDHIPILGVFLHGGSMVAVFFVVSGFSVSYSTTRKIQKGDVAGAADSLASSTFRRWPRLYLPIFCIAFIQAMMAYMGIVGHKTRIFFPFPRFATFGEQMYDLLLNFLFYVNPVNGAAGRYFAEKPRTNLDGNTWTIPVEFFGSMVVFLSMLATMRFNVTARLGTTALLIMTFWSYYLWDTNLFLVGLLLAQIHCIRHDRRSSSYDEGGLALRDVTKVEGEFGVAKWAWIAWSMAHFIFALYLLGVPPGVRPEGPNKGFEMVSNWTPQSWLDNGLNERFRTSIAATYLMVVLETAPFLQTIFTTRIALYLGKISYSLYLLHSTTHKTFGWWVHNSLLANVESPVFKACISYLLLTSLTVWVSDLSTRFIDEKAVALSRRLYTAVCRAP